MWYVNSAMDLRELKTATLLGWPFLCILISNLVSFYIIAIILKFNSMTLIPYRKNTKVGFCLPDKKMVIEPKYDEALPFIDGYAWVKLHGKWGVIKEDESYKIEPKYTYVDLALMPYYNNERQIRISIGDKSGLLIDYQEIIPPQYDYTPIQVAKNLYLVVKDERVGYVNQKNEIIVPFEENLLKNHTFSTNGKVNWIQRGRNIWNIHTNELIEINEKFDGFEFEIEASNYFCCFKNHEKIKLFGIQDSQGELILEPKYNYFYQETPNFITSAEQNSWGVFSLDFKTLIPPIYDRITHFKDDIFICHLESRAKLINSKNIEIPFAKIPNSAIITEVFTIYNYIEYFDNEHFNYCDFDGKVYFSIPLNEIQERCRFGFQIILDCFPPVYVLRAKDKTYIFDQENHSYFSIDFPINQIQFFDKTFANITDLAGKEFLFNMQTKKKDYPFKISFRAENYYLITDENGKTGAMDKNENITMPIENHLLGFSYLHFGNYQQFSIQLHNKTHEHDAFGYPYFVDVIKNIVYAEDLPIVKAIDIQTITTYKKIKIDIPFESRLYEFWKNNPTKRWRKSLRAGDTIFTKGNIKDSEIILIAFIDKLQKYPNDKPEIVKQALLDIRAVQQKHGNFIDTLEREELCAFLRDAAAIADFNKLFEEFRSF